MQQYQEGQRLQGSDGRVYVVSNGVPTPEQAQQPQSIITRRADPNASRAADLRTQILQNQVSTMNRPQAPVGFRFRSDGNLEVIPGGPNDPAVRPKPSRVLREGDARRVETEVSNYAALKNAFQTFQPDFAGNTVTGDMENIGQSMFSGVGTPGQRDWWASFRATDNLIRNSLYGASLTAGEKAAYDRTTISPRMAPDIIRQNIATRAEIVRKAVGRGVNRFKAAGYNPEEVDAIAGEYLPDFQSAKPVITTDVKETKNPEREKVLSALIRGGADIDTINSASMSLGGDRVSAAQVDAMRAYLAKKPRYKGPVVNSVDRTPTTTFEQVAGGPGGAFFANAANAVTGNNLDSIVGATGGDADRARADIAGLSQAGPGNQVAGVLGSIAGGALAAGGMGLGAAGLGFRGMGAARGADLAYGGIAGAGEADGGTLAERLYGGGVGALAGIGGGIAGRAAVRGAGAGFRGVRDANTNLLNDAGVPLTVGQAAGGALKGVEDRLAGLPFIGDAINQRRREGFAGFADATRREAVAPIGAVPGPQTGAEAIPAMRGQVGNAYDNALNGVNVTADQPFMQGMDPLLNPARRLPNEMANNLDYSLNERVMRPFADNGSMTGSEFQQSLRGIRQDAASVRNQPFGNDFGNAARAAEGELEGLLQRQAPGVVPQLRAANAANRNVSVLRDATAASRSGAGTGENYLYSPAQLSTAANANAKRFGQQQGTPDVPFYSLTNAGQAVLPSKVPDSGTAGRALLAALLPSAVAGGAGYGTGGLEGGIAGLGVAGAGAALYSRGGQRQLVNLLMNRGPRAQALGGYLDQRAGLGGMFGASTGVASLPYFTGQ